MRPVDKPLPPKNAGRAKPDDRDLVASALQDTIGIYCSVCELPVSEGANVQSKTTGRPKGTPGLSAWGDLLLACNYCFAHRRRGVVAERDFLWADLDATFALTAASPFVYELEAVEIVQEGGKSERGDVAVVKANPSSPARERAQRTIDLYVLNTRYYDAQARRITYPEDVPEGYDDMRLQYRTREWMRARAVSELLQKTLQISTAPEIVFPFLRNTSLAAQASGFWSVWMTVFWQAFRDPALLDGAFVATDTKNGFVLPGFQGLEASAPSPRYRIFPGTARERIQYPGA
ncbi:MAG: hypothetical protein ABW221_22005 [Vicinamibacteria bacterium]